ncbi:hypothetical protein KIP88_02415 [Bradyrhizobium sp. SRL28]|uniref:hypothetical protein n=1 Tax=Bradyrhizobium sp. SRL28 TaxID=2836178 RepID=UPI001BDEF35C|nr:hypothetical protein [Bradyrhizobium sp. SRL28]MBT1509343.1 hypothetical protein [Bradyrhizobium sp. SRL28]
MTPQEIHNRDVGGIVKAIIKPTLEAGHDFTSVLVILESVIVGVMLFAVRIGYGNDERVLDRLMEGVKTRLEEQRAKNAKSN